LFFGSKAERTALKKHMLTTYDPRMVDKYNRLAKKKLKKALITERLTALSSLQREQWTDKKFKEYNALHQKSVAKIYFMTKDGTQTE
jgi:hypothetical protein